MQIRNEAPDILVRIRGAKPGRRIGVVKFYESGYYSCTADHDNWTIEQVDAFILTRNAINGISEDIAESAMAGSMFGWHVRAALPAVRWYRTGNSL